jgi:hypothetical protein
MTTRKLALIAVGIVGTLAMGTAGYFANEWRVCQALHDDYITSTKAMMADLQLKSAARHPAVDKLVDLRNDQRVETGGQTLFDLEQRCGDKASADAQIEAQQMVLGTGPY